MRKRTKNSYWLLLLFIFALAGNSLIAQNTIITDDDGQNAHNSAMLDVYSTSKGFLAPRMTSAQRGAISAPAEGLLVYDTDEHAFYMYGSTGWTYLDKELVWQTNNDSIYVIGSGKRYGVGTASPIAKLTVQGDATIAPDEPLFDVKNAAGDVIFAVYENEVKVNFKETAKGVKGGFAVGGLSGTKADPVEYMRITPDSVRIYIDDSGTKGVKGGFAVGGLSGTKGGNQYFKLDEESASIYLKQPAKGVKGGFAVGGLSGTKGSEDYLTIERDSARMYINDAAKGVKGGFAVGGLSGTKTGNNFLDLTPENYFIGQGAGANTQPNDAPLEGKFNQFFGYEAGLSNIVGLYNILIGYQAGHSADAANYNTIMGYQAGYTNTGSDNTFIGFEAGKLHTFKGGNVYIGSKAGAEATEGEQNVYIGESTGLKTTTGAANVFIGFETGMLNTTGSKNVFLGYQSGHNNSDGYNNVFVGTNAGEDNTTGYNNIFIGDSAAALNYSGFNNIVMGKNAAKGLTTGQYNVVLGNNAGKSLTGGDYNIFIGQDAGTKNTQRHNVFIGYESGMENVGGYRNVFVGYKSGKLNVDGTTNTYIGQFAGDENLGSSNTFLGYWAGGGANIGDDNVYLGYRAGMGSSGDGNVFIGNQVGESVTGSDLLYIDNATTSNPLIYGNFLSNLVNINGNLGINTNTPAYDLDINATDATLSLGGNKIGRLTTGTGIEKDIIPFTGSGSGFDLGNNTLTEHWDDVVAEGFVTYTKSEKLKSAEKINLDIDLLKDLEPVSYQSDETRGNQLQYGFTIESLSRVAPAALVTTDTDFDEETNQYITTKSENPGINYNAILPVVVSFMQQQQQTIEKQSNEIKKHAQEIEELKLLIESLK